MKPALFCFLGVGVSSALAPAVLAVAPASRPHIIFILSDDVGQGDLGCDGARKVKSPHRDRRAREGLRFTAAHSTASVCTPTRFAFMTGR
jgi:arylsulfatase A